jgi:hypothetical protein
MLTIIKIWILVNMLVFALMLPARAQQPTPAQTALQIDNVINQWAQTIEAQQKQIAACDDAKAIKPDDKKK